ncbi:MAG TPA: response regulator [Rectinemataceae bacterium]|nr:response regulator [Rectinemataceae bacterium]
MSGIAIVEDEYIVALDIRNFLERSGYGIAGVFASGEDLLDRYDQLKPDLIIMDIKIRGAIDGVDTAQRVYERYHTPVVLLTAYADDETVARAKITQPFGYLLKPFEERELRTAIEIALYRAAMESRLRESEERYRRLFMEGISGNFLAEPSGRITAANPAFRRLVAAPAEGDLPGLQSLFPDPAAWESFREGLASSGRLELAELRLIRADGTELLVLANAVALREGDGSMHAIQGELTDTTERRRLEERLVQAQKMEAVGRLAGGIAHDFNNVLTAILGYANLLAEELPDVKEAKEDVEGIRFAAARASNLTRQLLAFSRRQPVLPRRVDLNALIQDTERMLHRLLSDNISLTLALGASRPVVEADPVQLEQVLINLAVNARDAMPQGGILRIATRDLQVESPRAVGLDTLPSGHYVVLEVADSGEGIPAEYRDRIFEPFFTTKPKDQGTGLGLSTVYGIAKQAGGAVGCESETGMGAVFSVWLPSLDAAPEGKEAELEGSIRPRAPQLTVLFVDDDETLRALAGRFLSRQGHRVLTASNAGEALLLAESHGRPIDLLVADVVMPILDGYTLARRLSASSPGMAVLFVSGHPEHGADSESTGRFLAKPFTEAQLVEAVAAAIESRNSAASHPELPFH